MLPIRRTAFTYTLTYIHIHIILYKIANYCYSDFETLKELWILDYVVTHSWNARLPQARFTDCDTWKRWNVKTMEKKKKIAGGKRSWRERQWNAATKRRGRNIMNGAKTSTRQIVHRLFFNIFYHVNIEYISAIKIVIHIIDWHLRMYMTILHTHPART